MHAHPRSRDLSIVICFPVFGARRHLKIACFLTVPSLSQNTVTQKALQNPCHNPITFKLPDLAWVCNTAMRNQMPGVSKKPQF
jgi:hypothetical protein